MALLKSQIPLLYWILTTLWQVLVAASSSLLLFLCIAAAVYLFRRVKQG